MVAKLTQWLSANRFGLIIMAVTWLIFFSRTLFAGQYYFFDDLKTIFYPLEHAYGEFQHNFELPVWSNLFGFGHPLLAWGQLGFFTPLHIIFRLLALHPLTLLNVSLLTYFASGLVGMFVWLTSHRLQQYAAALGAIVFVFCGFHIGHLGHINFYTSTMWLPWLLLAIDSFLKKPTLPKTALLALTAAVIPLSGQPQIALYTLIVGGSFGIVSLIGHWVLVIGHWKRFLSLGCLAVFLFLLLSSFATLPLREFLPLTDRATSLSSGELYEFSYPPAHAITLLQPYSFGNYARYWGAKNFQELAAYVGIVPLVLIPFAFFWRQRNQTRLRIAASIWILIALLLAPGIHSPLYRLLVENHAFPPLTVPGRFIYFFDVGAAILAAVGAQHLLTSLSRRHGKSHLFGAGMVILASANLIWWGWNYNPLAARAQALTPSPLAVELRRFAAEHMLPPRLLAAQSLPIANGTKELRQATEAISPAFTIHQPLTLTAAMPCLHVPTKVAAGSPAGAVSITASRSFEESPFYQTRVTHAELARVASISICLPAGSTKAGETIILSFFSDQDSGIKLLQRALADSELPVSYVRVRKATPEQLARSQKNLHLVIESPPPPSLDEVSSLLLRHLNVTAGSSSAGWVGALPINDFRAFIEQFFAVDETGTHPLPRNRHLADMAGITHLAQDIPEEKIDSDPALAAGYRLVAESREEKTRFRLYENPQAFPKAFLVGGAKWEPVADDIRFKLMQPEYSARELVYLSGETPPADLLAAGPVSGTAAITQYGSSRVEVKTKTSQAAWLVLTDAFTPAWQAQLNGQSTPIYIANSVFRAVFVPAGEHTITFAYTSPAVETAKKLTGGGLIACVLFLLPWRRLKNWNISLRK